METKHQPNSLKEQNIFFKTAKKQFYSFNTIPPTQPQLSSNLASFPADTPSQTFDFGRECPETVLSDQAIFTPNILRAHSFFIDKMN